MAFNNEDHCFCAGEELRLFELPPVNASINKTFFSKTYPLNSVKEGGPIEFVINSNKEDFINLNETFIKLICSIKNKDNSNPATPDQATPNTIPDGSNVFPVNYLLGALFKDVEVYANNKIISSSNNLYPYKSYIELMLGYDKDSKKEQASCGLYFDENTAYDSNDAAGTNYSAKKRFGLTSYGKSFELFGRLHNDVFQQERLLPGDLPLRVRLIRNDPNFCLMAKDAAKEYKIIIEEAILFVKRKELSEEYLRTLDTRRNEGQLIKYPYKQILMKYSNQSPNITNLSEHRLISNSPRPDRIIMGLCHAEAFNGSLSKSPFHFPNFNVESIQITSGLSDVPFSELKLDYTNNLHKEAYIALLNNTGHLFKNHSLGITPDEFSKHVALYSFDFTKNGVFDNTFQLSEIDTLHVDVKLKAALDHAVVMIFYMEFTQILAIAPTNDANLKKSM